MSDIPRKKTLDELRSEAIAELARRGYDEAARHRRKSDKCLEPVAQAEKNCKTISNSQDKQN